jgi:hypothetical protein
MPSPFPGMDAYLENPSTEANTWADALLRAKELR